MGVSFKVSKAGKRYLSKPQPLPDNKGEGDDVVGEAQDGHQFHGNVTQPVSVSRRERVAETGEEEQDAMVSHDGEVSFVLCLFPDGYTVGKASEGEVGHLNSAEVQKLLHPYDRASESFFSAIESGRLPGDILDDIPCKYINGMIFCEVRDYRKCYTDSGVNASLASYSPIINKLRLRMTLENVVKDIPMISDNAWTYGDLMEVESRILKALQPELCLDPKPKLDRLSYNPMPNKVNFAIPSMRKRYRHNAEVTTTPSSNIGGKKVCIDRVPESSMLVDSANLLHPSALENLQIRNNGQNSMFGQRTNSFGPNTSGPVSPLVAHPSKHQMGLGSPRLVHDNRSGGSVLNPGASLGQDMLTNYNEALHSGGVSIHNRRDTQEGPSSPLYNSSKRNRVSNDGNQQHHIPSPLEGFHGTASQWKNITLQQPSLARGLQYGNSGMQKHPQQVFEGGLNQEAGSMNLTQGLRYGLKEEPVDSERLDKTEIGRSKSNMSLIESELNYVDSQQFRLQQNLPLQVLRSNFPQAHWNSIGQPLESNSRKDDQYQKRKAVQSPRASAAGLPQSPLSSKSGEFSSGSVGPQVGAAMNNGFLPSQKDRSVVTSTPQIGASTSMTSSANDSMQRQNQTQFAKRRSNSVPKTPAMSGVGSPASVSNTGFPANVSSPSVSNHPLADHAVVERFSKIDMLTVRYQLNRKKDKMVEPPVKSKLYPSQQLLGCLSTDSSNESSKDDSCTMLLSKSLVGGSMNVCKARVMNFMQTERILQGNSFSVVPNTKTRTRLIMSEKSHDGSVAFHMGEIQDAQYLAGEDYLPTLPNTHIGDLLAAQFCSLMTRDGYLVEDHIQPKPVPMVQASTSQSNTPGIPPNNNAMAETQQSPEGISSQPGGDVTKSSNVSSNQLHNSQDADMRPSGNVQGLQISQGLLSEVSLPSRSQQQLDPVSSLLQQQQLQIQGQQPMMQQQQQHSQAQRSFAAPAAASQMSHFNAIGGQNQNVQLGTGPVGNRPTPLQLQLLQQQQQQQQQQQHLLQRKMMMNLGTVGMGNVGNNMAGHGAFNNVMNMAGVRGMGNAAISTPLTSIGGMGNMAQNPINLSQASSIGNSIAQQVRSGQISPAQAALMAQKLKMAQSRGSMLGGPQSVMGTMTGPGRQMHAGSSGLSMLGPPLSRGNISSLQRGTGQMGPPSVPPKLMAGMNAYMNQQQQQQQPQQQQQQQQQMQLHQHQLQQLQQMQLQQQQQQQQQQMQQQQQQLQQQNESNSPLQSIVSSPQMGSPSNMGMPQPTNQQAMQQMQQQQMSPQQMSQRTPMSPQLSSGTMHTISGGNPEACPQSPQLSSHTLGSACNSPMDLHREQE